MHYKQLSYLVITALILWNCGDNGDTTSNTTSSIDNTTDVKSSSSQASDYNCRDGETIKDKKGTIIGFCSDGEWNVIPQSTQTESMNECQDGEVLSNNIVNYICSNGQWIPAVPTSQGNPVSNSSSSQKNVSSSTITSSSASKTFPSSSSVTTPPKTANSSSSVKVKSSSSTNATCKNGTTRTFYLEDELSTDMCQNGQWGYPSNACEKTGTTILDTKETIIINETSYTVYCYNGKLHFSKTCKEGDRDTVTRNGIQQSRVCTKNGLWSTIISRSSSSSFPNESSSSVQYQDCRNKNISYGTLKDIRNKRVYKTVVIGKQTWMAENLNYVNPSDPLFRDEGKFGESIGCYNQDNTNCEKYGRFYKGSSALDSFNLVQVTGLPCKPTSDYGCPALTKYLELKEHYQGLCPAGWHIPNYNEIGTLINFVDGRSESSNFVLYTYTGNAGKKLKAACNWYDYPYDVSRREARRGTDDYGFYFLPDHDNGNDAAIWYIEQNEKKGAVLRWMSFAENADNVLYNHSFDNVYLRCVKD